MTTDLLPYELDARFRPGTAYTLRLTGPADWLNDYSFTASLGGTALSVSEDGDELVITISAVITTAKATPEWSTFLITEAAAGVVVTGRWEPSLSGTLSPDTEVPIVLGAIEIAATLVLGPAPVGGGGGGAVDSVNGQTGVVVLDASDVGADATGTAAGLVSTEAGIRSAADVALDGRLDVVEPKVAFLTVTQPVDLDTMEARVASLDAAVVLRGGWDASAGTFPGGGTAQAGDSYIVTVGGTVNGIVFTANDRIVAILDNASTGTYLANWLKLDYTDQVLSVDGQTGAVDLSNVYQAKSSELTTLAGVSSTVIGRQLLAAADATAVRALIGLVLGTDIYSKSALDAIVATLTPLADPTGTGTATWPSFSATGKTGAQVTPLILAGSTTSGPPTTGAHLKGEIVADDDNNLWRCTVAGTPGTWAQISGSGRELAYTQLTSAPTAITAVGVGAKVDVAGLTVTFTPGARPVLLRAHCRAFTQSVATNGLGWAITDSGGTIVGDSVAQAPGASPLTNPINDAVARVAPAAGVSITYKVMAWAITGGSALLQATATSPIQLHAVEI